MNPRQTMVSFFLILTSILMGFQVDRWWEERRQREMERNYLERLREDFKTDEIYLARRFEYFTGVKDFGQVGLAFLGDPATTGREREIELLVAFYLASHAWDFKPSSSTFQEMKSEGSLTLIKNTGLRSNVAVYYQDLNNANYVWQTPNYYRRTIRSLIPASIQRTLWEQCHELTEQASKQRFIPECTPDLSTSEVTAILDKIQRSPAVEGDLNFLVANTDVSLDLFQEHLDKAHELILLVSTSLEGNTDP
jgi:hypothetical protein